MPRIFSARLLDALLFRIAGNAERFSPHSCAQTTGAFCMRIGAFG